MRKNKWTILLATLALSTTLVGFSACGEDTPTTPPTPPPTVTPGNPATDYIFPADSSPIVWADPTDGDGSAFGGRYACSEGYYEIDLPANTELFYEFSVEQTGMYALYTLSAVEGVQITQYDASIQYIPSDIDGNFIGNDAEVIPAGNGNYSGGLYSRINCAQVYYSANWRATYGITSTTAQTIKIRFARIGDELYVPQNVITMVQAEELDGKFYMDTNVETPVSDIAPVPFSVDYFYDEDYEIQVTPFEGGNPVSVKGFYRIGTEQNPGEVIYAMLTQTPTRMFDTTFVELLDKGTSLRIQTGTADNGDYLINDYIDFLMNDGDTTKACYQNAVNAKGLYPVNQELFEFLNYYVGARGCAGMSEAERNAYPDAMWLAPCYFYGDMSNGTEQYPYALQYGDNEITLKKQSYVFYNVRWTAETNASTGVSINQGFLTISSASPNVVIKFVNDDTHKNYVSPFSTLVEADVLSGVTIMVLYTGNEAEATINLNVAEAEGTDTAPIQIKELEFAPTVKAFILANGTIEYFAVYEKRFAEACTVSVNGVDNSLVADFTVNGETFDGDGFVVEVPADGVITIVVTSTELFDANPDFLKISFTVSPAVSE